MLTILWRFSSGNHPDDWHPVLSMVPLSPIGSVKPTSDPATRTGGGFLNMEKTMLVKWIIIWMFPKIVVPQIIHFNRVFHCKPSILGYHYFWKHLYVSSSSYSCSPAPTQKERNFVSWCLICKRWRIIYQIYQMPGKFQSKVQTMEVPHRIRGWF